MVLGSDTILTEDILPKKQFIFTFYEHLRQRAEQITENATSTGSSVTIFTIPDKKTFYLTSLYISGINVTDNTNDTGGIQLQGLSPNVEWTLKLTNLLNTTSFAHGIVNLSFNPPIQVEAGAIRLFMGVNMDMTGTIIGYLLPKTITGNI